jgi:hypothetical protein
MTIARSDRTHDYSRRSRAARSVRARFAVLLAAAILFAGCPKPIGEAPDVPVPPSIGDLDGTWLAETSTSFFGTTLHSSYLLSVDGTTADLQIDVDAGADVLYRVALVGLLSFGAETYDFEYTAGTQSADNGDGSYNLHSPVPLAVDELSEVAGESGGSYERVRYVDRDTLQPSVIAGPTYERQ